MFDHFLHNTKTWLSGEGPAAGIVFSSRIRLARNIADMLFPGYLTGIRKEKICAHIIRACQDTPALAGMETVTMSSLSELDRLFLLERHLISQEHAATPKGRGLVVAHDERTALMINEEDHLRMQAVVSGFDLESCWDIVNEIDNQLQQKLGFAFTPEFGYLTSCPTNTGTGIRASCMMHLPALVFTKRINKILGFLAKIGFAARGFFGEGTLALGDFFQISNQVTLGVSEREAIDNLRAVVNQVREQEVDARAALLEKYRLNLEDNIYRSMGILQNCRLLHSKEALSHLSMLSLGVDVGIISTIGRETVNAMIMAIQPAHLQKLHGAELAEIRRDAIRADTLRKALFGSKEY